MQQPPLCVLRVPVPAKDPIVAIANSLYSSAEAASKPAGGAPPGAVVVEGGGGLGDGDGEGSGELDQLALVDVPQAGPLPTLRLHIASPACGAAVLAALTPARVFEASGAGSSCQRALGCGQGVRRGGAVPTARQLLDAGGLARAGGLGHAWTDSGAVHRWRRGAAAGRRGAAWCSCGAAGPAAAGTARSCRGACPRWLLQRAKTPVSPV